VISIAGHAVPPALVVAAKTAGFAFAAGLGLIQFVELIRAIWLKLEEDDAAEAADSKAVLSKAQPKEADAS
jgi:hypothetical protein